MKDDVKLKWLECFPAGKGEHLLHGGFYRTLLWNENLTVSDRFVKPRFAKRDDIGFVS